MEERKVRWGVTSPIYQSKVLAEFPDISDNSLILPKWIEAAQKRTLERTRRPIIAADIARFGEDETVIMRREGGWIRVYRAHHKADTMTKTGHIAKAMRDIDDEARKNDWGRIKIESKDDNAQTAASVTRSRGCHGHRLCGRANAAPLNVESHAGESITEI